MEQKGFLLSALGVGVGVGVGLGLASNQTVGKWTGQSTSSNAVTAEKMEQEMLRQVVDGRESNVTFDQFPYYLRSHLIFHSFFFFGSIFVSTISNAFLVLRKQKVIPDCFMKLFSISVASRTEACVSVTQRIQKILPSFFFFF